MIENLFATVTNVDFDPKRLQTHLTEAVAVRDRAKAIYQSACTKTGKSPEKINGTTTWQPAKDIPGLVAQGKEVEITKRLTKLGPDVTGLQELVLYGLKGAAAYADHARVLGQEDPAIYASFHEALDFLTKPNPTVDELVRLGDEGRRTEPQGHGTARRRQHRRLRPSRADASARHAGQRQGDLSSPATISRTSKNLLKQTEGKGINVYTHGEMLPCHGYPGLKKYKHLVGNYGGAWQDQAKEFDAFPGAMLMTTNCIQKPRDGYKGRIFTSGLVALAGSDARRPDKRLRAGHRGRAGRAGIRRGRRAGEIHHRRLRPQRRDGRGGQGDRGRQGRQDQALLPRSAAATAPSPAATTTPSSPRRCRKDCVILTLACGKYRFNKLEFGDIGGIPRLLDIGQCNDAYSAIQIAVALAGAFNCGVNDLPLSMVLCWYEQKAVAILLTLLHLGIKNIRLGPSLPAFVTPAVLKVLVEKFNIAPITTADADLKAILG